MYFFNENDFNVTIQYDLKYRIPDISIWGERIKEINKNFIRVISPGSNEITFDYSHGYYISLSNLNYKENNFVYLKLVKEKIYKTICKGLDDGKVCSTNLECGSGNCILGVCSPDQKCYNNDCNCNENQFQFKNNMCIDFGSKKINETPISDNPQECITNYIDSKGVCKVSFGKSCEINTDCQDNCFCIRNICSQSKDKCYNNDCKCSNNEIQYKNQCIKKGIRKNGLLAITGDSQECTSNFLNDQNICLEKCDVNNISYNFQCISKYSTKNGVYPETGNSLECVSGYINSKTGLCSKNPSEVSKTTNKMIIFFIILIFIGVILYFVYKYKKESLYFNVLLKKEIQKKRNLSKDIEYLEKELSGKNKIYNLLDKKMKNIEYIKNKTKKNLDEQKLIKQKLILAKKYIDKKNKEISIKKENYIKLNEKTDLEIINYNTMRKKLYNERNKIYTNKQSQRVKINENGYEVFANSGYLFHIYWFKKFKGPIKPGNEIHHIDGDKRNNKIDNLIQISKEDHKKINHGKIRDKLSGLAELKRVGIKLK